MEKKLRELISKFLKEYNGHHTMKKSSPRPFADDLEELENYMYKSIYGGDGGHYKNEPAFANPNRTKMGMFELKKFIKKIIKEQAYGHATLTTQGAPRTGIRVPTDEYPFSAMPKRTATGMFEQEDEPIDPDYQGPSYDEVYLKNKLVGFKDAYEYDKEKGRITIYPDLGALKWKTRSTQEIVFKLIEGNLHFVRAFGMTRSYDELKKVLPELGQMGDSSYSGFMNVGVDDQPISLAKYGISGIEIAHDMIQALNIGREGEAAAQSKHYGAIRTPGTGGTGIDEELTDNEEEKLKKIEKELNNASKMHKGQAKRIGKIVKEQSIEDLDRKDIEADKGKAKRAIKRIEIARQEAIDAASQGKGEATQGISQQEEQLQELNNQVATKKQEYTSNRSTLEKTTERYKGMPIDTDEEVKLKEEALKEIYTLRDKVKADKQSINDLRKQRNEMSKGIQSAISAQTSQPSVTKQFDQQLRDAKKALNQVGKMQETLLHQYEKERVNINLMEQMDIYNETTRGSLKTFFEMFEAGRTTSEVIRHYAKKGIQIPEQFCSKVKKQFESYKKLKLELGFSEQEAKDFKKALDLSQKEETKQISTKIFKK